MKILGREYHQLKNGKLFVMFIVQGKNGETLDLGKEGIKNKLLFFHETPATMDDCSYYVDDNLLELGGSTIGSSRNLYLIAGDSNE